MPCCLLEERGGERRGACRPQSDAHPRRGTADLVLGGARGGPRAPAEGAWLGRGSALFGDRAAVAVAAGAGCHARLARDHTDLGERAADLPFAARVRAARAGGLGREEALLGVRAAVLVTSAVPGWRGWGGRGRPRRGGLRGEVVEVEGHLDRAEAVGDGRIVLGVAKSLREQNTAGKRTAFRLCKTEKYGRTKAPSTGSRRRTW